MGAVRPAHNVLKSDSSSTSSSSSSGEGKVKRSKRKKVLGLLGKRSDKDVDDERHDVTHGRRESDSEHRALPTLGAAALPAAGAAAALHHDKEHDAK